MPASFDASKPIYRQLATQIYWRILREEWKPGEKLPSVRDTAVQFGVNPNTVSRTYNEMERDGVVETKRGQGTFVTENKEVLLELRENLKQEQISQFTKEMNEMGFSTEDILSGVERYLKEEDND